MTQHGSEGARGVAEDEIDLIELVRVLWAGKLVIAGSMAITLLAAILYLNVATYTYSARLMLTPAQASGSTLTSKLGGLGDLASLAGFNMPQDSSALAFSLYVEGVHSRNLAEALVRHQDLMRIVFEAEWNARAGRWQEPTSFVRSTTSVIKRVLGVPAIDWATPDGARLHEFINENVSVEQDTKKPFVTLTFDHKDPNFAVRFLDALNAELDNMLRATALERANANIEYLSTQLRRVTITEHREALAQALSEQEKQRMAASSTAPYAAEPFGTATASRKPTSPNALLVLSTSLMAGFLLGTLAALGATYLRRPVLSERPATNSET